MMDYTELLPPLPEPHWPSASRERPYGDAYSATNVRDAMLAAIAAAAPAIRKAERERCAKVCDLMRDRSLGAQAGDPSDLSNVMLRQVAELGWGQAAEAIRALPEEP